MPVAAVRPFVDGETIDLTAPESASPVPSPATAHHKKVKCYFGAFRYSLSSCSNS